MENNYKHFINHTQIQKTLIGYLNNNDNGVNSLITITQLNLNLNSDGDVYGLQKYYKPEKFNFINQQLKSMNYEKKEYITQESVYENKIKIRDYDLIFNKENDNQFFITYTLNTTMINNIVIFEQYYQNIEPTQFPNIVKYSKYKKYVYEKNNISLIFKSYNFKSQSKEKQEILNCEIVIKKYVNFKTDQQLIKEIIHLIQLLN